MLHAFSCCDKATKTHLFQAYCLSLTGSALWNLASPLISSLEVAFNNIIRKIWSLPRRSHTALVHLTASLSSVYNMIYLRSASLFHRALTSKSSILRDVFLEASGNICTFIGYNLRYGCRHIKVYKEDECLFANNILRDVLLLLLPSSNGRIQSELLELSYAS